VQKARGVLRAATGDLRGRALVVVLGCMVCQMGLGFGYIFGPLAKDVIDELGWSRGMYSWSRIPQLAVMAISSPIIGTLTIRYGARPVLTASIALLGISFVLISGVEDVYVFYAWMALLGLGLTGVGDITVGQVVSHWVDRGRGFALGVVYIGSNLGGVLLIPLAMEVARRTSWRQSLLMLALGAFFVMLPIALLLVRDAPGRRAERGAGTGRALDVGMLAGEDDLDLWRALRTRSFWILFFALFTFFFYFLALLEHLVLFLTDEGVGRGEAVALYTTAVGLGIWSKLLLGLIADRVRERRALAIVYGGLALSSLVLLALPHPILAWLYVVSFGFSYAARDVVFPLIVTRCFGLTRMAQIYGALMVTLILGAAGPWFAATVHDRTGSYDLAFAVFAGLNVLALMALPFARDERRARAAIRS
jgi:cyanate permease